MAEALNTQVLESILQQGIADGELCPLPIELLEERNICFASAVDNHVKNCLEEAARKAVREQI